ncbi:MAG: DNA-binding response regulator [Phycisphaerae bacterium]|nr:MAG: DNA-binding response regulator [Phycisphaerae bacterium]
MAEIRVLLVDDHAMLRAGLRMLIASNPGLKVVGEAGDLRQAIDEAKRTTPDVVVLDLSMPGGSGVAGIERLRAAAPDAKILMLTMHDDPAYVRSALAMGATGYIVKSAADAELISAIRAVAAGRVFVDMKGTGSLDSVLEHPRPRAPAQAPIADLSEREREVLIEVARGYTSQQIAERIGLSVKTVESYRARMMQKLGLKTRADIMRLATECGLLGGPDA